MYHFLDFEKPISILEGRIEELKHLSSGDGINIGLEVSKLEEQLENELKKTYSKLTPWDKVKVARKGMCKDRIADGSWENTKRVRKK